MDGDRGFFGGGQPFFGSSAGVQTKLRVGQPGDKYEREADAVADRVVRQTQSTGGAEPAAAPSVQRMSGGEQEEQIQEKEEGLENSKEDIQRKPIFESEGVQSKNESGQDSSPPDDLESRLGNSSGGDPLPEETRGGMESAMGADFSGVRVHTGSDAVQMNRDLGSQAFTHGNDIYFNEGKYDTDSSGGQHLLAHELTHTMQQGASQPAVQTKDEEQTSPPEKPNHALDISTQFKPDRAWRAYLEHKKRNVDVRVKIGNTYEGVIRVSQRGRPTEGQPAKYDIYSKSHRRTLDIKGMPFLNPLKGGRLKPILVLNSFGDAQRTTGFISVSGLLTNPAGLLRAFNNSMEAMGFLGLDKFALKGIQIENKFDNGRLNFSVSGLKTQIDNYISASGGIGISGDQLTLDFTADVSVPGVAQGQFNLKRLATGQLEGRAEISADIANVNAVVVVEYLSGVVSIQGTGTISSEKFTGSVSFLVTDRKRADETMRSELGVQQVEQESAGKPAKNAAKTPQKEREKSPRNQVVVGWGTVTATITPWLEGTAKIGIDSKGHVTMVGEIVLPDEVPLIDKEYGKKITIIDVEIKGGYGVPLVGQIFLFAGVELFINAGFGPLILKDVKLEGTYSTDPAILQSFNISGTLAINAFAILGLRAEGGLGVTLIGHDIKAGLGVTAAAGLRAYAEATPMFEYVEKGGPAGGKVGEAWLKGHFEAAAQLFLQLGGDFFVELDSPWWSPAPDEKWTYPLGSVDYPIGDSMGIGADVAWLVGSPDLPELKFTPVEFDPAKFTKDVMADPPPGGGKGGEKKGDGKWEDQSKKDDKQATPETKDGKGLPGKKKEDLTKLPDEQRYMRGLKEIGDLGDKAKNSPITEKVLAAKLQRVKAKYALNTVKIDGRKDGEATVYVSHKAQNNSRNKVKVKLMSEMERMVLLQKASAEFKVLLESKAGDTNTISESDAKAVANAIQQKNSLVIEAILVKDGVKNWDFMVDVGDETIKWSGMAKSDVQETEFSIPFVVDGEGHHLHLDVDDNQLSLASNNPVELSNHINQDVRKEYEEYKAAIDAQSSITGKKKAANEHAKKIISLIKKLGLAHAPGASAPAIGEIDRHKNQKTRLRTSNIVVWYLESEHVIPRAFLDKAFSVLTDKGIPAGGTDYKNMHTVLIYKGAADRKTDGSGGDQSAINLFKSTVDEITEILLNDPNKEEAIQELIDFVFRFLNRFADNAVERTAEAIVLENEENGSARGPANNPESPLPAYSNVKQAVSRQIDDVREQLSERLK